MPMDPDHLDPRLPASAEAIGCEPALSGRMDGRRRLEQMRSMLVDLAAGRMTPGKTMSVEAVADGLAALLKGDDVQVAIDAAKMLGGLGRAAARAVGALAAAIDDGRQAPPGQAFPLWWWAANSLEQIGVGSDVAVAPLARRMQYPDTEGDAAARLAWLARERPAVVRELLGLTAAASGQVRRRLMRFLVRLDRRVRPALEAARRDPNRCIRSVASAVLGRMG